MQAINDYCSVTRTATGIAQLTITNAGSLNIMNSAVMNGVREGLELLAQDRDIRALVVRGSGEKSMIGGADIKEMATLDQASAEKFITTLRDLCEAARQFPAPVIARLRGWCLGGGLEFAAACDLRIASEDAKFAMPEVKVGIPSVIHAALLPRLIGWGRARWLILMAATIDAPTALNWGLVDQVVPDSDLDQAIEVVARGVADCAPEAMRNQKALLRQWEELPLTESVNLSIGVFGQSFLTGEPQRHMQAFLDRRK
ncbi:MAG: enoyl-CoA hydratase [Afipia sp. 62-7]|nr:enoyl-CoA hydratase/isomerase family protein [Afipia sp.]OJU20911.1 MAG: enoyl-CoA hydratase [Afipia sp. 62-7]